MRFHRILKIGFGIATIVFQPGLFRQARVKIGRVYGHYIQSRL